MVLHPAGGHSTASLLLRRPVVPLAPEDFGGGGSRAKRKVDFFDGVLGRQILREDEEIMVVIMAATRMLQ